MSRTWAFIERTDAPDYDEPDRNYMTRWRVLGTPWFGVYLHRIDKPDPRPTLHDHPWPFISLVLRGGYTEDVGVRSQGRTSGPLSGCCCNRSWRAGSVYRMRVTDAHTITVLRRSPTWTLVLAGRRRPEPSWGYWDQSGWTPHDEHPHAAEFERAKVARRGGPDSPESFALLLSRVAGQVRDAPETHLWHQEVDAAATILYEEVGRRLGNRPPTDPHDGQADAPGRTLSQVRGAGP